MATALQTNRRLLSTLLQAFSYYRSRPTIASHVPFRGFAEATASAKPPSTGFSVSFADGNLENLLHAPPAEDVAPVEEVRKERRPKIAKVPKVPKSKKEDAKSKAPKPKRKVLSNTERSTTVEELEYLVNLEEIGHSSPSFSEEKPSQPATLPPRPRTKQTPKTLPANIKRLNLHKPDIRPGLNHNTDAESTQETPKRLNWQIQKAALAAKFGTEPWAPRKRLSPDTIEGIRALNAQYPTQYTTPVLAAQFAVSAEAIRRILKSKWSSSLDPEKQAELRERWARRHDRIWDAKAAMGLRPQRKEERKVEDADRWEEELKGREMLEEWRAV